MCKLGVEPGYHHFIALNWFLGGIPSIKWWVPRFHFTNHTSKQGCQNHLYKMVLAQATLKKHFPV